MPGPLYGLSLLAVFAHPDDESLACGGLMALCAMEGMHVSVVCATRGEDGRDESGQSTGEPIQARRARELAAAADALGVESVTLLDFEDGMLPWVDGDELEEAIAAVVGSRKPDAVITFDEDGLYWHPDHIAVHLSTTAAIAAMGEASPALYYASLPEGRMRALVDAVRKRCAPARHVRILGVDDVDAFGTEAPAPTLVLDVAGGVARKLAALRCHVTQTAGGPFTVLTDAEALRYLGVEQLRRAQVGDTTTAVLELLPQRM